MSGQREAIEDVFLDYGRDREDAAFMSTVKPDFNGAVDQVVALIAEARREGQAEALRAAARSMRSHKDPGHWNLRDEIDPVNAGQSPDAWLERRADRIENGDRHVDQ